MKKIFYFLLIMNIFCLKAEQTVLLKDTIKVSTGKFTLFHGYNYLNETRVSRWNMISSDQNPFKDSGNTYGSITFLQNSDTIFRIPSAAMTEFYIDTSNRLIIGFSRITLWNPYNIIVLDFNGHLLLTRRINVMESKMNLMSFCWFKLTNQQGYKQLTRYNCINKEGSNYYLSYLGILDINKYQRTKKILRNHVIFNHVFKNITSDGTIMYHCFNPDYKLTNVKVVKSNQISIILTFNESIELKLNARYYNKLD